MRAQTIQGVIRRRMLVNFWVDPEIARRQLPQNFRPKIHNGVAVAGICLIRLEQMRPKLLPSFIGLDSENAAHRMAVVWDEPSGETREGVFVVRRDTSSAINQIAGGRLFPGQYHPARFEVMDSGGEIVFEMKSLDGDVTVKLRAKPGKTLPANSRFATLDAASSFFEPGALGYSSTGDSHRLEGMRLKTKTWRIEPLEVNEVYSSYFSDAIRFPEGTIGFDSALLMRDIEHEWESAPELHL